MSMTDIENYAIKKIKCYDKKWFVQSSEYVQGLQTTELIVDGKKLGDMDVSRSRYFFKNQKYGQLYYARVGEVYYVFRECNRVGYVEPRKFSWGAVEEPEDE